ncbi:MAG: DUF58 domain-containing protein [Treponema sp.]|jgi:uncharacterized protein (DUF58 family)|nr:DUF58 domain-containing protein [Treponema sp.]
MDTHELLQKITTLPIAAEGLADDMLAGNFRSVFKGQGMEFDEARHYQWGDDVRSIDWNASARFGTPFVKMYREERELTIMILLDTSASMRREAFARFSPPGGGSGGERLSPYEQGIITAALIAFSAERGGQRVGAFLFDREIERVFPPRKGRRHTMALISGALQYQNLKNPRHGRTGTQDRAERQSAVQSSNLRAALTGAGRLLKRRSMVVLISDFLSVNWEHELAELSRRHDVIAIRITGPLDNELPDLGLIAMEDPETLRRITAATGYASFRDAWTQWHRERGELWLNLCRRSGAAFLEISTDANAAPALFHFFGAGRPHSGHRERQ